MTLCLPVHACDMGSGGAVELSWKLRPASSGRTDKFVECQPDSEQDGWGPVAKIRLHWNVAGVEGSRSWSCDDNHGATRFELDEGRAELWVTPECETAPAAQNTYIAPAILQREVTRGETVSLGAVELVVSVTSCATADPNGDNFGAQPCICPGPN